MKFLKNSLIPGSLLLLALSLCSCTGTPKESRSALTQEPVQSEATTSVQPRQATPASLPVQYQKAAYVVDKDEFENLAIAEESKLLVGARITSTRGPQPLWDIVKRLAALKGMNVSWASDVDKNALVDVDINANDDFYEALDNMLRQVDYFHQMEGNTIVIKYKETKEFQVSMPFTKLNYSTGTGGNLLGSAQNAGNLEGTINLTSKDNEFDIWDNIKLNLDTILQIWTFRREGETVKKDTDKVIDDVVAKEGSRSYSGKREVAGVSQTQEASQTASVQSAGNVTGGQGYYLIDKPVGLVTVTAPRPVLEKVEAYFTTLKKSLYQQIAIEAKIIEVQLIDNSDIGINWTNVLRNFDISGLVEFGANGQVFPGTGRFVSRISLADADFDIFLNALKEQGDTKILSNPKLSVMNGQPALISVGRNVTFIESIESDLDSDTGIVTLTVNTDRVLSGLGMSLTATILGKDDIVMNLVPITSQLEEPIPTVSVGQFGDQVGLPVINVREMSTTVKVKDGEMLVIGGLIDDNDQRRGEFAPVLGDIPLVKYLFGHEEKDRTRRELIILLRPRII